MSPLKSVGSDALASNLWIRHRHEICSDTEPADQRPPIVGNHGSGGVVHLNVLAMSVVVSTAGWTRRTSVPARQIPPIVAAPAAEPTPLLVDGGRLAEGLRLPKRLRRHALSASLSMHWGLSDAVACLLPHVSPSHRVGHRRSVRNSPASSDEPDALATHIHTAAQRRPGHHGAPRIPVSG